MNWKRKFIYYPRSYYNKTEKYINEFIHNIRLKFNSFIKNKKNWKKLTGLLGYLATIAFTGVTIHYSITHFNWISVGIIAALSQYYIEWFINTIKAKQE